MPYRRRFVQRVRQLRAGHGVRSYLAHNMTETVRGGCVHTRPVSSTDVRRVARGRQRRLARYHKQSPPVRARSMSSTRAPRLAAVREATIPPVPPPTTTMSHVLWPTGTPLLDCTRVLHRLCRC